MANLRGKKPVPAEDRLKAMLAGPPGSGKSTACTQFERCYFIDTERGANKKQYTDAIIANGGVYWGVDDGAGDPDEVLKEIETLTKTRHEYRTVVLDSLTTLFEAKVEEGAVKVGTDFGKNTDFANRWAKKLFRALTLLDCNIIVTSHVKDNWSSGERSGVVPDGFKKASYLFDAVFMLERRPNGKRFAVVEKTRYAEFPDRDSFEFSYAELERRWGKARLEKEAVPVALATPEQVADLTRKIEALAIPQETQDKWLKAADADTWADLTSELINKAIAYCQSMIDKAAGKE